MGHKAKFEKFYNRRVSRFYLGQALYRLDDYVTSVVKSKKFIETYGEIDINTTTHSDFNFLQDLFSEERKKSKNFEIKRPDYKKLLSLDIEEQFLIKIRNPIKLSLLSRSFNDTAINFIVDGRDLVAQRHRLKSVIDKLKDISRKLERFSKRENNYLITMVSESHQRNLLRSINVISNYFTNIFPNEMENKIDRNRLLSNKHSTSNVLDFYSPFFETLEAKNFFEKFLSIERDVDLSSLYNNFSFLFYAFIDKDLGKKMTHIDYMNWLLDESYVDDEAWTYMFEKGNLNKKSKVKSRENILQSIIGK